MPPRVFSMSDASSRFKKTSRQYEAFRSSAVELYRVKIRPKARAWERMTYSQLLRVVEDGYGNEVGLLFSFAMVLVKGRNLEGLADALDQQRCDVIYEFDERVWDMPADPKAPFVESIKIVVETREEIVEASDKMLSEMATIRSRDVD